MIAARIISLLIGYGAGLFQTGLLVGKKKNADLRHSGSGNTGVTNSIRVMGMKAGVVVALGDVFKCIIAMIVVWLIFRHRQPEMSQMLMLYAGLGTVLGHDFPFYTKFKGGKGIAVTCGIALAYHPMLIPICAICFFGFIIPTGYMSLGSLAITSSLFVQIIVFGQLGLLRTAAPFLAETYVIAAIITVINFVKHRENIKRLAHGEERKFMHKKEE